MTVQELMAILVTKPGSARVLLKCEEGAAASADHPLDYVTDGNTAYADEAPAEVVLVPWV